MGYDREELIGYRIFNLLLQGIPGEYEEIWRILSDLPSKNKVTGKFGILRKDGAIATAEATITSSMTRRAT